MQKKKRQLPIDILEALNIFKEIDQGLFEITYPENSILEIRERNPISDFRFVVDKYERSRNINGIRYAKNPQSENYITEVSGWTSISNFQGVFHSWVSLVTKYNSIETIFDDPITQAYQEEFYQEWKIVDEEADTKPFPTDKILLLDTFLEQTQNKLILPEYKNEENEEEIDSICADIQDIRNTLTQQTQNSVIRQMSKAFSKIAKLGVSYVREFFKVAQNEAFKDFYHKVVEGVKTIAENTDIFS